MIQYDYFLICPVKYASDESKSRIGIFLDEMEKKGKKVYYPARDTDQTQPISVVFAHNLAAMSNAKQIALFYDKASRGTIYDLGVISALGKIQDMLIINPEDIANDKDNFVARFILETRSFQ